MRVASWLAAKQTLNTLPRKHFTLQEDDEHWFGSMQLIGRDSGMTFREISLLEASGDSAHLFEGASRSLLHQQEPLEECTFQ